MNPSHPYVEDIDQPVSGNPAYESQPCAACDGLPPEYRACLASEVLALAGMSPGGFA